MPLLAVAVTACGPPLLDRDLRDIPSLGLYLPSTYSFSDSEDAVLHFDWSRGGACYQIPADTRLTINSEAATLESRGDTHLSFDGAFSCDKPSFKGSLRPADEPRTEFILSDDRSKMRAVFQELRAPRRFRVNGQEQATVRSGAAIDIEWLPVTDQLEKVDLHVESEGGSGSHWIEAPQVEGNHVRFTLPTLKPGRYVVSLLGQGAIGVEACEGFSSCRADFFNRIDVPFVVE
ncbi:hypothetical protein DAT35_28480 [Vitiosangium sp. GDMCC 1.1324]|nr:hypothetical protein DAT35_28480 [Vitiosangium sp. GDMCC 1.1324]